MPKKVSEEYQWTMKMRIPQGKCLDGACPHFHQGPDLLNHKIDSHTVVSTLGDNHVGMSLGRFDKFHVHGPNRGQILLHDGIHRPSSFANVASQAADKSQIRIGIHENLDI